MKEPPNEAERAGILLGTVPASFCESIGEQERENGDVSDMFWE